MCKFTPIYPICTLFVNYAHIRIIETADTTPNCNVEMSYWQQQRNFVNTCITICVCVFQLVFLFFYFPCIPFFFLIPLLVFVILSFYTFYNLQRKLGVFTSSINLQHLKTIFFGNSETQKCAVNTALCGLQWSCHRKQQRSYV